MHSRKELKHEKRIWIFAFLVVQRLSIGRRIHYVVKD